MNFKELGVKESIVKALEEQQITEATSIQEQAIPLALAGKNVIGMSRTGSGKTAAFGIPILDSIQRGNGIQALVLTPTRELAVQISREFQKWSKYNKVNICTIYGGVAIGPQTRDIKRADVIVGTPGRVLDHIGRGNMDLSKISTAVLDEADKMVEMGFIQDVERIFNETPDGRQVLLFGATLSEEIGRLKRKYMPQSEVAKAELQVEKDLLEQYYYNVMPHEKFSLLVHLLKKEKTNQAIIFCSTRATVDVVSRNLKRQNLDSVSLHGKMTQGRRLKVLEEFNAGKRAVLVASAVAARGLDINDVSHVFNYDLSKDPQEYIHRVGRTARAGNKGKAITLLAPKDHSAFSDINKRYPIHIKKLENPKFDRLHFNARPSSEDGGGRFGGGRRFGGFRGGSRGGSRGFSRGSSRGRSGGFSGNSWGVRPGQGRQRRNWDS